MSLHDLDELLVLGLELGAELRELTRAGRGGPAEGVPARGTKPAVLGLARRRRARASRRQSAAAAAAAAAGGRASFALAR